MSDPEPRQIVTVEGASSRRMFASRATIDENTMAAMAAQCRAATSTAETTSRNQTTPSTGASGMCVPESGSPTKTWKESSTSSAVRTGSRYLASPD